MQTDHYQHADSAEQNESGERHSPQVMPNERGEQKSNDPVLMIRQMRAKWLWTNWTIILLGVWLLSSPFTFGYTSTAMIWSDVMSGVLMAVFAAVALWPRYDFLGRWSVSLVGLWLQVAPLIFWAPTAVAYVNDTLLGVLAITLSILVPMMPGMAHHMVMTKPGPEVPPGWTYNPSSWHQRAPMIALAFVGWLISRYLAAYQLGYTQRVWEPFFGAGTVQVLTSDVSRMMPVSDAGMGALAYSLEMLMAWMGGRERWRSMPWMVTFFFILVVPLGITHVLLVILQPMVVGSWCTLCLAAALLMLLMIPLAVDEVVAMGQFLFQRVHAGKPFWRTFWVGDTMEGGEQDLRTPRYGAPVLHMIPPMSWGVTVAWSLLLSVALGGWLLFAPTLFGTQDRAADSDHLVGALIVTCTVIAMAEVTRPVRFVNIVLGLWLVAAPWMLAGVTVGGQWNGIISGLLVIVLSIPRGHVRERYGSWQRYIV